MPTTALNVKPKAPTPSPETLRAWGPVCAFADSTGGCAWSVPGRRTDPRGRRIYDRTPDEVYCSPNLSEAGDWRGAIRMLHAERGAAPLPVDDPGGLAGRELVETGPGRRRWMPSGGMRDVEVGHDQLCVEAADGRPLLDLLRFLALSRAIPAALDLDGAGGWKARYFGMVDHGAFHASTDVWRLERRATWEPVDASWRPSVDVLVEPPAGAGIAELIDAWSGRQLIHRLRRAGERDEVDLRASTGTVPWDSPLGRDRRHFSTLCDQLEERLILARRNAKAE